VEFNRALDRQRRAKEAFAEEIAATKEQLNKRKGKEGSLARQSAENPEVRKVISQRYPALDAFEAYPDFVNPFTTYMAGVFFNLVGDPAKAVTFLKESAGMVPENKYIAEDLALAENILDGRAVLEDMVWVVFENGLGPAKEEFRIDIPLFVATDKVKYVGIALPKLVFREQASSNLSIRAGNASYSTQMVANMDRVIQTEFEKDFKGILTRAIISATSKAIAQYAIQKNEDSSAQLASLLVAAYSYATTAADVRIWTTLPKNFQVTRFAIPENRKISVTPAGLAPFDVEIPPCKNAIVYIKIPYRQANPVVDIIPY